MFATSSVLISHRKTQFFYLIPFFFRLSYTYIPNFGDRNYSEKFQGLKSSAKNALQII